MYVCLCQGVTDTEIKEAIGKGAKTLEEVIDVTKAGSGCMGCIAVLQELLGGGATVEETVQARGSSDSSARGES